MRFYRAVANPYGYIAKLYTAGGTLLGSVKLPKEDDPARMTGRVFCEPDPDQRQQDLYRGLLFRYRLGRLGRLRAHERCDVWSIDCSG
jgi:hypothetical protein